VFLLKSGDVGYNLGCSSFAIKIVEDYIFDENSFLASIFWSLPGVFHANSKLLALKSHIYLAHTQLIYIHFQRQSVLGNPIEMDIMMTVEDNETLLRVGVSLQSMEARHRVSEALERNYERGQFFGFWQYFC
jgi:hypothetical protein